LAQAVLDMLSRAERVLEVDPGDAKMFIGQASRLLAPALDERTTAKAGLAPWQERRAKELLSGNLTRQVSLAEVAAECALSRGHFSKAFKATTGHSPHAWLIERRIEAARQMLQASTASLSEIAIACGFADQSHLTRVFGARVGSSPAQWRRMRRH
jgi:AraC-like DNA-binding protein